MIREAITDTHEPAEKHALNNLSRVFIFKILATVFVWCLPLFLMPTSWFESIGFPKQGTYMFVRMLGWAYLALCVGYGFGLKASLAGERAWGPIWVGIVSNGGACLYLCYYGATGTWVTWGAPIQFVGWGSAAATFVITLGLVRFGIFGERHAVASVTHDAPIRHNKLKRGARKPENLRGGRAS